MTRLVRKNLIVDADALRELARERGTSESEAARDAIGAALAWHGMASALEELEDLGAFSDTARVEALYGSLPPPLTSRRASPGGLGAPGQAARSGRAGASCVAATSITQARAASTAAL
jgi:hypothetical protein